MRNKGRWLANLAVDSPHPGRQQQRVVMFLFISSEPDAISDVMFCAHQIPGV
jgi:hypothetical protein